MDHKERVTSPELVGLCKSRYDKWTDELLKPFDRDNPSRLVTEEFYQELTEKIRPEIIESVRAYGEIEDMIESQSTVSERNAMREKIIRDVAGGDPLEGIKEEKVRRRVRAAMICLLISLQHADKGADVLEEKLAPRAWHFIKENDIRGVEDTSGITHLDTKKGGKLASVSPRELAYSVQLLS